MSFDCYGTLIDWEAGIAAVLGPWATRHGLDLDEEQLLQAYAVHEAKAELEHPTELYPDILARSFRSLGEELGVPITEEDAAALASSVPDWPAFEDSHDALTLLGERFKLIILSNVDRASFAGSEARPSVLSEHLTIRFRMPCMPRIRGPHAHRREYLGGAEAGLAVIGPFLRESALVAASTGGSRPPWGPGRVAVLPNKRPRSGAGPGAGSGGSRAHAAMMIFPRVCPSP